MLLYLLHYIQQLVPIYYIENLDNIIDTICSDDIYHLESDDNLHAQEHCHNVFVNENNGFLNAVAMDQVQDSSY